MNLASALRHWSDQLLQVSPLREELAAGSDLSLAGAVFDSFCKL